MRLLRISLLLYTDVFLTPKQEILTKLREHGIFFCIKIPIKNYIKFKQLRIPTKIRFDGRVCAVRWPCKNPKNRLTKL